MNVYIKRVFICALIVVAYFTLWKSVRGLVTTHIVVPQIEYAISNCDETIAYDQLKSTSLLIHILDREKNEYVTHGYTAPAGFYLLFGLVFIILSGGDKLYYYLLLGFHIVFWLISSATVWFGLCYESLFIHFTFAGIKYLTPFFTFLILILLISPNLQKRLDISDKIE